MLIWWEDQHAFFALNQHIYKTWNLTQQSHKNKRQFVGKFTVPNHVIIIKTKVLLPQAWVAVADLCYPFRPFVFLVPKDFLFGFQIFLLWVYLIKKVIPETRRAH